MFPADTRILIVEDSAFARNILKRGLKDMKFTNVIEAENGSKAQDILASSAMTPSPIQLLISDLHMPDKDGLELIRWVRSLVIYRTLPIIMLSSSQQKNLIFEAGRLGVNHYLIKPYDENALRTRLEMAWTKLQADLAAMKA